MPDKNKAYVRVSKKGQPRSDTFMHSVQTRIQKYHSNTWSSTYCTTFSLPGHVFIHLGFTECPCCLECDMYSRLCYVYGLMILDKRMADGYFLPYILMKLSFYKTYSIRIYAKLGAHEIKTQNRFTFSITVHLYRWWNICKFNIQLIYRQSFINRHLYLLCSDNQSTRGGNTISKWIMNF